MTWIQSANRDDVLEQSGLQGWESTLHRRQPDEVGKRTSGGASVSFVAGGANVSAGTTADDVARIDGMNAIRYDGLVGFRTVIAYTLYDTPPYTDDCEIGWMGNGLELAGAWLDVTDGEYKTTSTNTATATLPPSSETAFLTIEIDISNGETRFEQSGAVNESVTIASANVPTAFGLVRMESNGGGESVEIPYVQQTIHGKPF